MPKNPSRANKDSVQNEDMNIDGGDKQKAMDEANASFGLRGKSVSVSL